MKRIIKELNELDTLPRIFIYGLILLFASGLVGFFLGIIGII